jgi:hypothetical protein
MQGLYKFIENLCRLSTAYDEDIVTQWGDTPIVIEPGNDPFIVYKNVRDYV